MNIQDILNATPEEKAALAALFSGAPVTATPATTPAKANGKAKKPVTLKVNRFQAALSARPNTVRRGDADQMRENELSGTVGDRSISIYWTQIPDKSKKAKPGDMVSGIGIDGLGSKRFWSIETFKTLAHDDFHDLVNAFIDQ